MSGLKGQSDIIAVVLILLIAIGLLSVAYTFGLPLIQKNQDKSIEGRAKAFFSPNNINSLTAKIQSVANSDSKDVARLDVMGAARVFPSDYVGIQNNSIEFSFQSSVTSHANDIGWISLNSAQCNPVSNGIIGQDEPAVVCVRADTAGGGYYNITYRIQFRELEDAQRRNGFKINLVKHPSSPTIASGSDVEVRLEFDDRKTAVQGSKTLISTDVKVLLV